MYRMCCASTTVYRDSWHRQYLLFVTLPVINSGLGYAGSRQRDEGTCLPNLQVLNQVSTTAAVYLVLYHIPGTRIGKSNISTSDALEIDIPRESREKTRSIRYTYSKFDKPGASQTTWYVLSVTLGCGLVCWVGLFLLWVELINFAKEGRNISATRNDRYYTYARTRIYGNTHSSFSLW